MDEIEFTAWPKTPRLFKDSMVITEKIDGTNSAVGVVEGWVHVASPTTVGLPDQVWAEVDGKPYTVYAQSRNRLIKPASTGDKAADNYGFASWVYANHHELARVLGVGLHYGEWWGCGIGRNYGLAERRFSLFNTSRWKHLADPEAREAIQPPEPLTVVPVLDVYTLDTLLVREAMQRLRASGSQAAPGFMNPEGICVFLPSAGKTFKVTFDGDEHKGVAEASLKLAA
jgi:hypothetical protein